MLFFSALVFILGYSQNPVELASTPLSQKGDGHKIIALFFKEVRFSHYNRFQKWTRPGSAAEKIFLEARKAKSTERPLPPFLNLIRLYGNRYHLVQSMEEDNVHYIETIFLIPSKGVRRRNSEREKSFIARTIGFMITRNEKTDQWQMISFQPMGHQVITRKMAEKLSLITTGIKNS